MAHKTLNITNLEQGDIEAKGDKSSNSRVRTSDYITFDDTDILYLLKNVTVKAVSSAENRNLQSKIAGYLLSDNAFITSWVNNSSAYNLSSYGALTSIRVVFHYSYDYNITSSEITESTLEYDIVWVIDENENIKNDFSVSMPENFFSPPFPSALWRIENGTITHKLLNKPDDIGAFANAINLRKVYIPPTVKKIGRYSFRNTKLTSVTIAKDCAYYPTSFPDNCTVNFYP